MPKPPPSHDGKRRYKGIDATVGALITSIRTRYAQSGKIGLLTLDDHSARIEAMLGPEKWAEYESVLAVDAVVVVEGELAVDDFNGGFRLRVKHIRTIAEARAAKASAITLRLHPNCDLNILENWFKNTNNAINLPVVVELCVAEAEGRVWLGGQYRLPVNDEMLTALQQWQDCETYEIEYIN